MAVLSDDVNPDERVLGVEMQREDLLDGGVGQDSRREPRRFPRPRGGPGDGQDQVPRSPGVYQIVQTPAYQRYEGSTAVLKIGKSDMEVFRMRS